MNITALFRAAAAVDGGNDTLLLLRLYADGIKRLPCAAIRANEGLIVRSGQSRRLKVPEVCKICHRLWLFLVDLYKEIRVNRSALADDASSVEVQCAC